jgi:putative restriction endonuclease
MAKSQTNKLWTEKELVAVLSLYCQLPFGQMDNRNLAVRELSKSLNRTPSSIALKLVNFASLDPALRERGIRGMSNVSRLDRKIWDDYYGKWAALGSIKISEQAGETLWGPRATSVERVVVTRVGQGFFRNTVLAAYEGKCCITGITAPELLRASHIVPWSVSEARRVDPTNGLCLNALHDAAFDRGLIGLDSELKVRISATVRQAMPDDVFAKFFGQYEDTAIRAPQRFIPDAEALRYHLENVFIS